MTTEDKKIIRDFIYLDVDRLYSLYSQVFEGVTQEIVDSLLINREEGDIKQEDEKSLESKVARASLTTEKKFLYDYMYTRVEGEMAPLLWTSGAEGKEVVPNVGQFLKVSGQASIQESKRLIEFLSNFNKIGEAITNLGFTPKIQTNINELTALLASSTNMEEKKDIKKQLDELKAEIKIKNRWAQDPTSQDQLAFMIKLFLGENYEINIQDTIYSNMIYRAILDQKWLRASADYLRQLYGGLVESSWTLVGHVTYSPMQDAKNPAAALPQTEGRQVEVPEFPDTVSSMRDPYTNMENSRINFERMFFRNKVNMELIVRPLAIYEVHTL